MKTVIKTNDFAANMEDVIAANTPEIDSVDSLGTPDLSLVSANTPGNYINYNENLSLENWYLAL